MLGNTTLPSTTQLKPFQSHAVPRLARRTVQPRAGLFDFIGGSTKKDARSEALVEELISRSKSAGSSASRKQEVVELAQQLKQFRPRAPTRSPLFWGDYEVTFSTNPNAAGGPVLRSGPGQVLFSGQKLRQTLQQPGTLINTVEYKSLGVFPGQAVQTGEITILDGNRYQVDLGPPKVDVGGGVGGSGKGELVRRQFEVLYLDERVRVVNFLPDKDEDREPSLFVFERLDTEDDDDDDEEEEDEEVMAAPKVKQGGTRRLSRPGKQAEAASPGERQLQQLKASLSDVQAQGKSVAQQLREKEKGANGILRGAKPASAQVDKAKAEAEALEAQLREAVEAQRQAEARLKDAQSELRIRERELA